MRVSSGVRRATVVLLSVFAPLTLLMSGSAPASASTGPAITVSPTVTASSYQLNFTGTPPSHYVLSTGVSCVSSAFCMSVGEQGPADPQFPWIQQYNGTTWSTVPSPSYSSNQFALLEGVSCASVAFCAAVGETEVGSGAPDSPVAMTWNGSVWTADTVAAPAGAGDTVLSGVSCLSATWCVAVGSSRPAPGMNSNPWAISWNGSTWSPMSAANPGGGELNAVSCTAPTFCAAVGDNEADVQSVLFETFNGTQWTLSSTSGAAAPPEPASELYGVSCIGPDFCAAVGDQATPDYTEGSTFTTLAEMWNGQGWSYVSSPNAAGAPTGSENGLNSVSCFSATGCSAVGSYNPAGTEAESSTAAYWDGTSWQAASVQQYPNPTPFQISDGVSCVSDWACLSVGEANAGTGQFPYYLAASITRSGYRFVASDGGVFNYGTGAPFLGSLGGTHLNAPIVGMGTMPAGDGYYLVASDGGVFAYGSAQFYGSMGGKPLNKPIVGMAVTPDGGGYWLVASDGGVFAFGDAGFYGSAGSLTLNKPVVGIASSPNGLGYWIVASDGGVFNYGPNAPFLGSTGGTKLNKPVVGIGATTAGQYYLVASDGGIFAYPTGPSGPPFYGSTGAIALNKPIVGMTVVQGGYYLSGSDGGVFAFPTGTNGLPFYGSTGGTKLNAPIVGVAS